MKVKELIEKLKEFNWDEEIYYENDEYAILELIHDAEQEERERVDWTKVYKVRLR